MLDYESKYYNQGLNFVAGIDEAGRGPLAGPVAVAIVVMPKSPVLEEVNDSKKLSEKKREKLYDQIVQLALDYNISLIDNKTIDSINILNATKQGMIECINNLKIRPDIVLIDAVKIDTKVPTESIIHGDALSYNIACASILAKVTRDRLMCILDQEYPEYNFKKHKGYGTKEHIDALKKYGKCAIHRDTFIKNFVSQKDNETIQ